MKSSLNILPFKEQLRQLDKRFCASHLRDATRQKYHPTLYQEVFMFLTFTSII